ncbi:DUF1850 domain-containing protein [uncultured Treponema sp.]|uniref:DUF1850 domain-containing protein n=1 Tax=uncultured Treponema sp. TaxID=162155 RepID=UPI0025998079|nr:DUF1850 domain-containing protein [uncultured Treponema sp.]
MHNKSRRGSRHVLCLVSAAVLAVLFAATAFIPAVKTVSISNAKSAGSRVYSKQALSGFCISYTHSVNKGRVHDYYSCTSDNELVVDATSFVSYGAGIPEASETSGAVFSLNEDEYKISGLNRRIPNLLMAVGVIAEHSITIGNREFFLKDFFAPQTSVLIKVKKVPLLEYAVHKL